MLNSSAALRLDVSPPMYQGAPLKILILDDSKFDRLRINREIQQTGVLAETDEIFCLCSLKSMLEANSYDLIVVDYYLPDGTGEDALKMIAADPLNFDAKTILVSGNPWICQKTLPRTIGPVEFIGKEELGRGKCFTDILASKVAR